ncbi:MAG TPA: hypothetical protein DHN29_05785 [Cytophagales bacterium]|nr:hypothetical protein [Cytophagales bacterium]|tara:strand:+ start:289 stop:594 length:306 start_codon:yes stop_codon:yes gene_type:complete
MLDDYDLLNIPDFLRRKDDGIRGSVDIEDARCWFMPDLSKYERKQQRKNVAQINALYKLQWAKGAIHRMSVDDAVKIIADKTVAPPRNRARRRRIKHDISA